MEFNANLRVLRRSLKKYQKETPIGDVSWKISNFESSENVEEDIDRFHLKKLVEKHLQKLPLNYRSPLTLCYLEDRSYEEISDILRIPIGTVGTRINRGKKLLAKIWTQTADRQRRRTK